MFTDKIRLIFSLALNMKSACGVKMPRILGAQTLLMDVVFIFVNVTNFFPYQQRSGERLSCRGDYIFYLEVDETRRRETFMLTCWPQQLIFSVKSEHVFLKH